MIEYTVSVYSNGSKHWRVDDKRHREDGPACEYPDGVNSYYLNDVQYTEEEFNAKMSSTKDMTVEEISKALGYEVRVTK